MKRDLKMKKIVPNPPLPCTSTRPFGRCDAGHDPLFSVNPNISAEDALVHVALYLRGAYETGSKALEYLREEGRGMYWSSLHSIELAEGLVEAILDGIDRHQQAALHRHSSALRTDAALCGSRLPAPTESSYERYSRQSPACRKASKLSFEFSRFPIMGY